MASVQNTTSAVDEDYGDVDDTNASTFRIIACYLLLVITFGTTGNTAVIYTFIRCKKLRTPTNLLIVNLSASDLLVASTGTPLSMISTLHGRWLFGDAGCSFYGFMNYYCGCISLNSLAMISFFRYVIVVRGTQQKSKLSLRDSGYVILIIHLYTLIFSTPPLFGWNRFVLAGLRIGCDIDFHTKTPLYMSYVGYMFIFLFFLPLGIITWSYFKIYRLVRQHSKSITRTNSASFTKKAKLKEIHSSLKQKEGSNTMKSLVPPSIIKRKHSLGFNQHRAVSTIIVTITVFLLAWLPYCVVSLWILLGDPSSVPTMAATIPSLFAKSSVIYNPFIYAILSSRFREGMLYSCQVRNCL